MIETYDWEIIERSFPYAEAMKTCIQDSVYHAEGDVWTHTRMVMDALGQFGRGVDHICRLTALYHDCRKPETRTVEYDPKEGRDKVGHPRHARLGAATAWYDLWLAGEDLETRLAVYWTCRWHQKVFHFWEDSDLERTALKFASLASWSRLIDFARADNAGRICPDQQTTAENLDLLEEFVNDLGGRPFDPEFWTAKYGSSDQDRIFYFEKDGRSPFYHAQEPLGSRVTVLSGLPGVGKDRHCKTALAGIPVVSLDTIRDRLKIDWTDNQGQVIQAALEEARVFLRAKQPFIWNAQCVTALSRGKIIRLCRDYDAHVTIHAFDRPLPVILRQNQERDQQVPEKVILDAARKWEPPSLLEAHRVTWV